MFKPLARSAKTAHQPAAGFAETQFLHTSDDDDYSGFAPTEMFDDGDAAPIVEPVVDAVAVAPVDAHRAASTSRTALERAATLSIPVAAPVLDAEPAPAEQASIPPSWVTSQWVAAQEAKAHDAADQARALIAAQRRAEEQAEAAQDAAPAVPSTRLGRLRAAFERLLPGEFRSLLPLFIGVTVTMALISAVLPLFDKP